MKTGAIIAVPFIATLLAATAADERKPQSYRFDFRSGKIAPGFTQVFPATTYTKELGYGFDLGSWVVTVSSGSPDGSSRNFVTLTSGKSFFFSVALPEGNYNVMVTFGATATLRFGEGLPESATVKAESRRLMLEHLQMATNTPATRTFTVNIRSPKIVTGGEVHLKPRESDYLHWDDKLTLEFSPDFPGITALEITPATNAITVYLLGDSTVTDQPREPWNSWGQMLPRFFKAGVAVANHAESGESIKSSISAKRFEKVFSTLKSGDYVFMQFGHNDMKDRAPDALATYRSNLVHFVDETRQRGATPVLVTSMERKAGVERDTLGDYPKTVRDVAREKNAALIDLHAMSKVLYRALGTNIGKAFQDGTHHNNYGSYELAKCVVEGIKANKLVLAKFIAEDVAPFDPAYPDSIESFRVPASPIAATTKPDGN